MHEKKCVGHRNGSTGIHRESRSLCLDPKQRNFDALEIAVGVFEILGSWLTGALYD